jgi:hypothetical protein
VPENPGLSILSPVISRLDWYVTPASNKIRREPQVWIFGGTAIMLLIAVVVFIWSVFQSSREGARVTANTPPRSAGSTGSPQNYEWLARFNPPAYRPGADDKATKPVEFVSAMRLYTGTDYSGAIAGLQATANALPDFVEARLYLGICYLYTNNRPSGIAELRAVIVAGSTPYLEQARFYLAKGLIGMGDAAGARQQLDLLIGMQGELAQQAETLLAKIK